MTIDANKENQTARTKRIVGKVLLYAVLIIASLLLLSAGIIVHAFKIVAVPVRQKL